MYLKNLGIVRRIDDLGRIVIPKEIRRLLKISDNENMEINVEDERIIIKKHSLLKEYEKYVLVFGKMINKLTSKDIILTDRDKIIYSNKEDLINKELSDNLKSIIVNRDEVNGFKNLDITKELNISSNFYTKNIIIDSASSGIILLFSKNNDINDKEKYLIDAISKIFNDCI